MVLYAANQEELENGEITTGAVNVFNIVNQEAAIAEAIKPYRKE